MTDDQHTDHILDGQQLSRSALPTLLYFYFPLHTFFKFSFMADAQMTHLVLPGIQADLQ